MKKITIKKWEDYEFLCDICGKKIVQDGKDIVLINDTDKKDQYGYPDYSYSFHNSCLNKFLRKYFTPFKKVKEIIKPSKELLK